MRAKWCAVFALVLLAMDCVRLVAFPHDLRAPFTDGFETAVAFAGAIACAAAARRARAVRRAQWTLVAAFFAALTAADLHDLIVDLTGAATSAPVLAIVGWTTYLPLALLVVLPRDREARAWTALSTLDLAQITLLFGASYFRFVYLAHLDTGGLWTTRVAADDVRNVVLTGGLLLRAGVDPAPGSRRFYGSIAALFGAITLLHIAVQPRAPGVVAVARPAALMGIAILAAGWSERAASRRRGAWLAVELPSWARVLVPACGPLFVVLLIAGSPEAYVAWFVLVLVVSTVMFAVRAGIAEHLRDVGARALVASEARLRQAQKLEALGRLAGGIAHDFSNMLTVVTIGTEAARRGLPPGDKRLAMLDEVLEAARHAGGLTKQLLAFSRGGSVPHRVLDLRANVRDTASLVERVLGERVHLRLELGARACHVCGDPVQLEQVLVNLALNARDAMPRGGAVTVALRTVHRAAERYAVLAVRDEGRGMTPEVQRQIFEPFFTTKPHGTGLGLASVYAIVKQHGGSIEVSSAVGRGTTIEVFLPRVDAPALAPDSVDPVLAEASARRVGEPPPSA